MQIIIDLILFFIALIILLQMIIWIWRLWLAEVAENKNDAIILEIKIPKIVDKSPKAMELILETMIQTAGVSTWYKRTILGNKPVHFALEIASSEGDVKFYIRTRQRFKQLIENAFYAQYPGIQVIEVDDYMGKIFYDHRSTSVSVWGQEYSLTQKFDLPQTNSKRVNAKDRGDDLSMSADIVPLRTYMDFGLDKDPKDQYKIDPLIPILEWLNSMGPGEYGYYQILVQQEDKFDDINFEKNYLCKSTGETFNSSELGKEYIDSLRLSDVKVIRVGDKVYDDYGNVRKTTIKEKEKYIDEDGKEKTREVSKEVDMTYGEKFFTKDELHAGFKIVTMKEGDFNIAQEIKDRIKLVKNKQDKTRMRAIVRSMYVHENGKAQRIGENIATSFVLMRPFGAPGYNSFAPNPTDPYDNEWDNYRNKLVPWRSEEFFHSFVEREGFVEHIEPRKRLDTFYDFYFFKYSMKLRIMLRTFYEIIFHPTHHPRTKIMTLSLEEIATLWHIPGSNVDTPGIDKIDSLRSASPTNLPV